MREKITLIILSLAVVLLLSGCGSSQSNTSENGNKNNQGFGYVINMINIKEQAEQDINSAVKNENNKINEAMNEENKEYSAKYNAAEIETNLGKIKVKFYNSDSPVTVNNFLKLADQKFYDGT